MKYVIIGGVAAGASAAARLRRLDEHAEIVLLERGASISYANCGLPYHVGGVIKDTFAGTIKSLDGFLDCYEGSKLKGMVAAPGIYEKGAIKGTKYLAQAYKLGLKVK